MDFGLNDVACVVGEPGVGKVEVWVSELCPKDAVDRAIDTRSENDVTSWDG